MHRHGWEWVKMHGNDSWQRLMGHGVVHSTTAGSSAEWPVHKDLSPSQRSLTGDTLMFSKQTSWHYKALKSKRLRREIKLQYEHVRVVQKSELKNHELEFELEVEQEVGVKFDLQWTTFELNSGNALPYLYIIYNILYPTFLLYTLYLFYSQHSACYILYLIFYCISTSCICILSPISYILFLYYTSNILYAISKISIYSTTNILLHVSNI